LALGGGGAGAAVFGTGLLASVESLGAGACGGIAFAGGGGGCAFALPPAGGTAGQTLGATTAGGGTGVAFALVAGDADSTPSTFRLFAVARALARMLCTRSMLGLGAGAGGAFVAFGGMRNPAR